MLQALRSYLTASMLTLLCGAGVAGAQSVIPTATLTVNGAETQPSGSWDNGNISVDFNGFVEIVNYAQYSTNTSLASALAAMFVRDYHSFGLYAKAGVNAAQPNVITFQLVDGSAFGPLNVVDPSVSFTLAGSGFASSSAKSADIGVATLTINGMTVASSNYGDGSNAASIAQDLASQAATNARNGTPVSVTSEGPNVYLQVKQPTGSYSYTYSLTFSTSQSFSTSTPSAGTLNGSTDVAPITVYSYCVGPVNPCPTSGGTSGYMANGNVQNLNDSVMGNWTYNYDDLNRLISGTAASGPYSGDSGCWSYDSFGNRTNQILSNAAFTTANGTSCQPASGATSLASPVTFSGSDNHMTTTPQLPNGLPGATGTWAGNGIYDTAGNVINDGVNTYTYDAEGRVCALNGPQGMIGYQYDSDGNRVGKGTVTTIATCDITANGYTPMTDYVLDQSGGQMTEMAILTTASGTTSTWSHSNVEANGALIATFDTTGYGLHFYLNDALGSRRVQTDPAGIPEQICQSLPFGDQLYCTGSLSSPTEHHFTGKERDTESGLDYFGARYYGSSMGRFTSPDPVLITTERLMNPQQLNLYAYVANNPLRFIDPTGEILQCVGDAKSQSQCFSDLQQIAGDAKDRLSMDAKTGVVSFDTKDLDLSKNEGASLVNDLVGSKNTYDFSVGPTIMTDKGPVRVDHIGTDMANLPTFGDQRQIGNPPAGVSDILDIYFNNPNMTRVSNTNLGVAPEWTVVFHELAEAYEKIDGGKGGSYPAGHNAALQREMTLRDQRPYLKQYNTGAGGPANSPNPQGGIIIKK
jgi:RHS repeat-associated protein